MNLYFDFNLNLKVSESCSIHLSDRDFFSCFFQTTLDLVLRSTYRYFYLHLAKQTLVAQEENNVSFAETWAKKELTQYTHVPTVLEPQDFVCIAFDRTTATEALRVPYHFG